MDLAWVVAALAVSARVSVLGGLAHIWRCRWKRLLQALQEAVLTYLLYLAVLLLGCSEFFGLQRGRARAEQLGDLPLSALPAACKRAIDIAGALALSILFSPLMLLVALLIKLTSPGDCANRAEAAGDMKELT